MIIHVRPLTSEEAAEIERRAKSRALPARQVQRARIIQYSGQGWTPPAIVQELGIKRSETVRCWIKRFNEEGLVGLEERPRAGMKH